MSPADGPMMSVCFWSTTVADVPDCRFRLSVHCSISRGLGVSHQVADKNANRSSHHACLVRPLDQSLFAVIAAAAPKSFPLILNCVAGRLTSRNGIRGTGTRTLPGHRIASHRIEQLFGLTAGFLTFARLIVPLRIALALALTPAADKYIVKGLLNKSSEAVDVDMAEVRVPRRGLSVDISPRFKMLRQESISAYTRLLGDLNYTAQPCVPSMAVCTHFAPRVYAS